MYTKFQLFFSLFQMDMDEAVFCKPKGADKIQRVHFSKDNRIPFVIPFETSSGSRIPKVQNVICNFPHFLKFGDYEFPGLFYHLFISYLTALFKSLVLTFFCVLSLGKVFFHLESN